MDKHTVDLYSLRGTVITHRTASDRIKLLVLVMRLINTVFLQLPQGQHLEISVKVKRNV